MGSPVPWAMLSALRIRNRPPRARTVAPAWNSVCMIKLYEYQTVEVWR